MKKVKRLLPYLRPYRRRLLLALAGSGIFTLLSLLPPLLLRHLIDKVITPKAWHLMVPILAALVLVPVFSAGIRFVNNQILMLTNVRFIGDLRVKIYRKILSYTLRFHSRNASGAIVGRLMDDVNMLYRMISSDTVNLVVDLIAFAFSLSVAFMLSWKLWFVLVFIIFIYVAVYRFFSKKIRAATQSYRALYDEIAGRLQENISGIRQIRIFNRQEHETELFLERMTQSLNKAVSSNMNQVGLGVGCHAVSGIGSTIVFGLGAIFVLKGSLTYGDLIAFDTYLWMAMHPAIRLTMIAGQLAETFVSVGRILDLLEQPVEIASPSSSPAISKREGRVEFKDVGFSYVPDQSLYKGLSIAIEAGTACAIVGPTGGGKTTLTQLLMRHWDVNAGKVLIDGTDIRSMRLSSLRRLFGIVLQSPTLFEGTFAENIAYGKPSANRKAIIEAAKAAEVYELAMGLPNGFDTVIGTRGIKLSVGEKQRVSIARAILKDPLILIMDEATSSLDSVSEALIQRALGRILKGRTSIVIAHRLSTVVMADQILVMDNGQVAACGTHKALLKDKSGMYYSLYQQMMGADG